MGFQKYNMSMSIHYVLVSLTCFLNARFSPPRKKQRGKYSVATEDLKLQPHRYTTHVRLTSSSRL